MPVHANGLQQSQVLQTPIQPKITNVSSVPQLSPFRYPGGKTWLVPEIREWLDSLDFKPTLFIEPFAGGGIASLTSVIEGRAKAALMCELDNRVASVWETILTEDEWLTNRIRTFDLNIDTVRDILSQEFTLQRDIAFQTIVRNRTQRGGILAPGASLMKTGENGKGVASRWYPETLAKRIEKIAAHRNRIHFVHGDGLQIINQYRLRKSAVFFVDPPYTAGGKKAGSRLYSHNELDHKRLFDLLANVRGQFLMTYDDAPEVVQLAKAHRFRIQRVRMKNTHHNAVYELLITKN